MLGLAGPGLAGERTVLVLGDSLSAAYGMDRDQGWVALLDQRLAEEDLPWRAANASTSGDTTRNGLSRLPQALERHEPDIVVVALGGNDGLRGVSPGEIERNLGRIVETARDAGARVLIAGVRIPPNYGQAYTERFTQSFANVATEYDLALVPRILDGVAEDPGLMQSDGIHPTADAQPLILDTIWPELRPMLAE
ncbi:acyl-CoA thioesterase-1 [Aquisalimonas asiatica]|uniref:Acyl-CoA thioesterase-1 n=1 Tax=Aquisalimonas asiatica TaxID=406100 RepID=A0A1H8VM09_9GAMM|nr:acyl-CoA thioesterase-1 [Aquisalimonas asiatica]